MHSETAVHHFGLGSDAGTHLACGIEIAHAEGGSALLQNAVEKGIEHKLRILLVVAYLPAKRQVLFVMRQPESDGVQTHAAGRQRVDMSIAVETTLGRCRYIEQHLLELDILTLQNGQKRILALAFYVELHGRQLAFQGKLVDEAILVLVRHCVGKCRQLLGQLFVVAAGIELDNEVAALGAHQGGILCGADMQSHEFGPDGLDGVAYNEVADESADVVAHLHVGCHVGMAAECYGQRVVHELHLVEIYLVDICNDGGIEVLPVQEGIQIDATVNQTVIAQHVNLCVPVTYHRLCRYAVKIPLTVAQVAHLGIGRQTGVGRQEIRALALSRHVGGNRIDRIARHEVMNIQIAHIQLSIVSHRIGIERACSFHDAVAFAGCNIGDVVSTVCLHVAIGSYAGRDAVVALHIAWQHGHHEAKVLGLGMEIDIGP